VSLVAHDLSGGVHWKAPLEARASNCLVGEGKFAAIVVLVLVLVYHMCE
jgi:hypothetical protein